jgi:uncharacterized protein (DUF58 family)
MAFAVFAVALALVAIASGNNLLYVVASLLLGLLLVSAIEGRRNLAGLQVRRMLPVEAFARRPARGRYEVWRGGRWGAAFDLLVEEGEGGRARAVCGELPAGARQGLEVGWRFERRGLAALSEVRVRSTYPFRLVERWVVFPLPVQLWVYPEVGEALVDEERPDLVGATTTRQPEDLEDLRPYREGDALRDVHWPTSARAGEPIVMVRRGQGAAPVWVRVPDLRGQALEEALRGAVASVVDACRAGKPVGLVLAGQVWPPRTGASWRRQLLIALAAHSGSP